VLIPKGDRTKIGDKKMSEIEIGTPTGAQIESKVDNSIDVLMDTFNEVIGDIIPKDVTPLKGALQTAEGALTIAMKGSAVEYIKATKARDEAKQTLHNATALTQDESTAISLNAHKFLVRLHEVVNRFDALHGISYAPVKGAKGRKKGSGQVTQAEYDSIPADEKTKYSMTFWDGAINLIGASGQSHVCRTLATLVRHEAN
jgi:hypothetical protein